MAATADLGLAGVARVRASSGANLGWARAAVEGSADLVAGLVDLAVDQGGRVVDRADLG